MDFGNLAEVGPGAWLTIAMAALLLSFCLTAVSYRAAEAYTAVEDLMRRRLRRDAKTFGEPTREQVEAPWRDTAGDGLPRRSGRS